MYRYRSLGAGQPLIPATGKNQMAPEARISSHLRTGILISATPKPYGVLLVHAPNKPRKWPTQTPRIGADRQHVARVIRLRLTLAGSGHLEVFRRFRISPTSALRRQ